MFQILWLQRIQNNKSLLLFQFLFHQFIQLSFTGWAGIQTKSLVFTVDFFL